MVHIEIDGQKVEVRQGSMVIEATDGLNIPVPRFCYHKKLSIAANCRMCLVEVEKAPKALPACATPVSEGMKVWTRSPKAIVAQQAVMEFLLINHPLDCPICDQGGECELQDIAMGYGKDESRYLEKKRVIKDKDLGPLIATDMTRCIHCTRCVRFGEEVAGIREMGATGRGEHTEIGTFIEQSVNSEVSGNIIDLCPVGALTSKPFRFQARAWEMAQLSSVSPHDCMGSNLYVHTLRGEVMRVVPKDNELINEVWISDRDRFSYLALQSDDRLKQPLMKKEDRWTTVSWSEALEFTAKALRKAGSEGGALISPNATLEECYLSQKLMRGLDSHNIDHRLRQTDFRDQDKVPLYPNLGTSFSEIEQYNAALLIGTQIHKELPLAALRFRKMALHGGQVCLINPMDEDVHFPIQHSLIGKQGDLVTPLAGVAKAIMERENRSGPSGAKDWLSGVKPTAEQKSIANALLGVERRLIWLGAVALTHPQASRLVALANLIAQLTHGALGCITEGANSAGAWLAGCVPHRKPGGKALEASGKTAKEMQQQPLKAYLLHHLEPDLDCAYGAQFMKTLKQAECVVGITAFQSSSLMEVADVLLPLSPYTETSGTYVNGAGTWQSFTGVSQPCGESRPGWKIFRVLGNLCNLDGFNHHSSEEVLNECRRQVGGEHSPTGWEWWCPSDLNTGKSTKEMVRVGTTPLYRVDPVVRRSQALQATQDSRRPTLQMNASMAKALGLENGHLAWARTEQDSVKLPLEIHGGIPDQVVLIPSGCEETWTLGAPYETLQVERA